MIITPLRERNQQHTINNNRGSTSVRIVRVCVRRLSFSGIWVSGSVEYVGVKHAYLEEIGYKLLGSVQQSSDEGIVCNILGQLVYPIHGFLVHNNTLWLELSNLATRQPSASYLGGR